MKNNKFSYYLVFFLFLVFINLNTITQLSTSHSLSTSSSKYGGTFLDSSTADAQIFNPVISSDSASRNIEDLIFEGMITYDKNMDVVPNLASRWEISTDKLDYTFFLRDDIYWHDGEQFTADDVIFTWNRILDPKSDTTRASMFDLLDLENVPYEMIDSMTVIFYLKSTLPAMINNLMLSIIPSHAYQNYLGQDGILHTNDDCRDSEGIYTFNDDPVNKDPIGTGCMMFKEWRIDDHIILIRNSIDNGGPGYWHEHDAYLDRYVLSIISDVNVQLLSLKNGDIDMMDLSSTTQEDIEYLRADPNIDVYTSPTFTSDHIAFQTDPSKGNLYGSDSRDFTSNPNHFAGYEWMTAENPAIYGHLVRQALNYAIDKQGLIEYAYPQGSRNLGPMYLAQYEWYNKDVNPYDYNLTKANELLEQAGFGVTTDDPLRSELDFMISFNQGGLRREKTCKFARDQWAKLGITVQIENLEWVSMLSTHYDGRNFDTMSAGWTGGGGDPDLTGVWSSYNIMPGGKPIGLNPDGTWIWGGDPMVGGLNYMSYWNDAVDLLMYEALNEEAVSVRKTYYNQIQDIIVNDSPYIWLLAHTNMIAVNSIFYGFIDDSVAGFWPEPVGFRNIYYASEEQSDSSSTIVPSEEGGLYDFFNNLQLNDIPIINNIQIMDIVLLILITAELMILVKTVKITILKK